MKYVILLTTSQKGNDFFKVDGVSYVNMDSGQIWFHQVRPRQALLNIKPHKTKVER